MIDFCKHTCDHGQTDRICCDHFCYNNRIVYNPIYHESPMYRRAKDKVTFDDRTIAAAMQFSSESEVF